MASNSIFMYTIKTDGTQACVNLYHSINASYDDELNYFDLELISDTELSGEFTIVQNVEETYYNLDTRSFEKRVGHRASMVYFYINDDQLEVWGNKTNANKLIFTLSNQLNGATIEKNDIPIVSLIDRLKNKKVKISKVCFEDFLFTEDIVGNFYVDLSSYGEAYAVLDKYKNKIARMTIVIPCPNDTIKMSITSKGSIIIYKNRDALEQDILDILHDLIKQ